MKKPEWLQFPFILIVIMFGSTLFIFMLSFINENKIKHEPETFQVNELFQKEGCKVYAFESNKHHNGMFTDCRGSVEWEEVHGKTVVKKRIETNKQMNEYENIRRIVLENDAWFIPVCSKCGRFVKADNPITFNHEDQPVGENATCKKCGRVEMIFEGYY